jgi:hypothetical protein
MTAVECYWGGKAHWIPSPAQEILGQNSQKSNDFSPGPAQNAELDA